MGIFGEVSQICFLICWDVSNETILYKPEKHACKTREIGNGTTSESERTSTK